MIIHLLNFEKELDKVSSGQLNWVNLVDSTYKSFDSCLQELQTSQKEKNMNSIGIHPQNTVAYLLFISKMDSVLKHNNVFVPLKEIKVEDMTLEKALVLLKYPMKLSDEIIVKKGKFGLYFTYNSRNYSLADVEEENGFETYDYCKNSA